MGSDAPDGAAGPAGPGVSHRRFLKTLGAAIGLAGVGQLAAGAGVAEADETVTGNLTVTGRVGVPTLPGDVRLDVTGRLRVRQDSGYGGTAGLYLFQTAVSDRAFVGMAGDSLVGFWGAGTSWNLVMNTQDGKVGIGTLAPWDRLVVVGRVTATNLSGSGLSLDAQDAQANGYSGGNIYLFDGTSANGTKYGLASPPGGGIPVMVFRTSNWASTFVWGNTKSPGGLESFEEKMRLANNGRLSLAGSSPGLAIGSRLVADGGGCYYA